MTTYPRNMPDDYRRNIYDLTSLIEMAQHYPDEDGGPDVAHMTTTPARADEIAARLRSTPDGTLIIQTQSGRFQIEVGPNGLTIIGLDVLKRRLVIVPRSGNVLEIWQQNQ